MSMSMETHKTYADMLFAPMLLVDKYIDNRVMKVVLHIIVSLLSILMISTVGVVYIAHYTTSLLIDCRRGNR